MADDRGRSTERAQARLADIARVLGWLLGLNLLVAAAKLAYGWSSGALAITADGVHSLLDGSSNVIGLIAIVAARRPPDANHPYGHRKYETFAALAIVGLMFLGCWEIVTGAIERLRHPRLPEIGPMAFVVMLGTLAVNVFVSVYERRQGRKLGSELLMADAAHTTSDVLASLLVIASLLAARTGIVWADAAAAAAIVLLIVRAGIGIMRDTLSTLSDERRLSPVAVQAEAMKEPGVLEVHNVRSRGPLDDIHLDLHVLVDPATPLATAHATGHRVEARLRVVWPGLTDIVVHVEPALAEERAHPGPEGALEAEG